MTTLQFALVFENVDLDDLDVLEALAQAAPGVHWAEVDGEVRAEVFSDAASGLDAAQETVAAVQKAVPDARAPHVAEEFVAVPDIAERCGMNRETVRLWTLGDRGPGGFPRPRSTVGNGIKIWDWTAVNAWLRDNYALGDGYRHLAAAEVARVNEYLRFLEIHQNELRSAFRARPHVAPAGWSPVGHGSLRTEAPHLVAVAGVGIRTAVAS